VVPVYINLLPLGSKNSNLILNRNFSDHTKYFISLNRQAEPAVGYHVKGVVNALCNFPFIMNTCVSPIEISVSCDQTKPNSVNWLTATDSVCSPDCYCPKSRK